MLNNLLDKITHTHTHTYICVCVCLYVCVCFWVYYAMVVLFDFTGVSSRIIIIYGDLYRSFFILRCSKAFYTENKRN